MDHRLCEIEAQPRGEHAASAPPRAAAVALCPSEPGHSPEATALDAARAEFRAAWAAKQARVERLRGYARKVERVRTCLLWIVAWLVFISGGVLGWGLLNGSPLGEIIRTAPYLPLVWGLFACSVLHAGAMTLRVSLQRSARRLEAAVAQYPARLPEGES